MWIIHETNLIPALFICLIAAIVMAVVMVGTSNSIHKSKCLNNDNARRWHNVICEEYQDGEWIEIDSDPFKKDKIYYNEAALEGAK